MQARINVSARVCLSQFLYYMSDTTPLYRLTVGFNKMSPAHGPFVSKGKKIKPLPPSSLTIKNLSHEHTTNISVSNRGWGDTTSVETRNYEKRVIICKSSSVYKLRIKHEIRIIIDQ